ncbi:two component transcriptional regulator [Rhodospirillum rubrum F11]|uniref:Two component transcriptional regulator, winged helix family n=2 Tax=Rhodospirillum rubrum TaxID=1085 RepID=Q2RS70_RHORT|nr:response regulator transcription factor [Rhodospirillum rubrum]ABC23025.1 two component transcriptional regulator, winged helix family [Rhodospirillum rubrum ATCC 11170]AEO48754.1 two component transcriptional regulator [Rhodospirillum rubrum F11]MBK5954653.1 DNA-binding response regulator [Rhodospirillum rubrum]QXG79009.1 response regulator transcription factor [Rhodospirillum rubrum]
MSDPALPVAPVAPVTEEPPHILVVDDDTRILALLKRFLSERGFIVTAAADAAEARRQLAALRFDLLVVDVMMPGESGLELTRSIREDSDVPILILTAMDQPDDRVSGLESGADDYLAKPFDPRELVLRVNGILRRLRQAPDLPPAAPPEGPLPLGACVFDPHRQELLRGDEVVRLTTAETALLSTLAARAGEAISREDLAELTGVAGNPRAIDVQVTRLRKKIEADPRVPRHLQTVRGRGYMLRPG